MGKPVFNATWKAPWIRNWRKLIQFSTFSYLSTFLNGNSSRSFAGFLVPSGKITNLVPLALNSYSKSGHSQWSCNKKELPSLLPQLVQALFALLVPSLDKGDSSKPSCQPKPSQSSLSGAFWNSKLPCQNVLFLLSKEQPTTPQCRAGIAWRQEKPSSAPARSPSMPTSPTRTGARNVTEHKLFQPDLMVEQKDSSTLVF